MLQRSAINTGALNLVSGKTSAERDKLRGNKVWAKTSL